MKVPGRATLPVQVLSLQLSKLQMPDVLGFGRETFSSVEAPDSSSQTLRVRRFHIRPS